MIPPARVLRLPWPAAQALRRVPGQATLQMMRAWHGACFTNRHQEIP